jgi:Zn-dependent protease
MSQFYKINSSRVSHREYWWGTKSPAVLIGWLLKWLRVPIPSSSDDPNTESTLPFVVESLPPEIASGFAPLTGELAGFGFSEPVYHVIHDAGTRTTIYWATFRHESGRHFARIHQRIWHQTQKADRGTFPMFFTAFTDGTFFVSSAGKPDMAAPATVPMNRMFRASAARLWEKHQQLLEKISERKLIVPVRSREDLMEMTERQHVLTRDFHLARGVFSPRTAEENAQADAFTASVAQAQAAGLENAEVLAELQKLQESKPGWGGTGWLLGISLVAFILLGAARWDWRFTLLIIPVLLFHECGHWAAMRIFRYRNLRMFFIPLFGAAVTGRNWNVPGWKKAVVSLAGPLPGIALGIFLGVAGLAWKIPMLSEAAMLLIFINGFNLLPVLPLDGGHVLHTILFCRNRWLDVLFRLLAIGGLLLLSIGGLGKVFMFLAIIMSLSLPVSFRLAQIADKLRKTPLPEPPPDLDQIPVPTAQAIIAEVKATFPKHTSNKQVAQHALGIFETLNARPPGTLGTIGLMAVHGGAFLLVAVFSIVLVIGQSGGLGDFAQAAMRQPQHSFKCGATQEWRGAEAGQDPAASHNLLVATFKQHEPAAAEFNQLATELPPSSRLTLFGDSLLLALTASDDAAPEKWFDRLQSATTNVFVMVSNQPVFINLQCIAPNATAATNCARDLQDYLEAGAEMHLVAPWSPEFQSPGFAAKRDARHEWRRIGLAVAKAYNAPALKDFPKKIHAADLRGARSEAARLRAEELQLEEKLQAQAREQFCATATNPVVPALVDLNAELAKLNYTNRIERAALLRKVAALLGEVRYEGDKPAPGAEALGAATGLVSLHGMIIELSWVQMHDAVTGLPALAGWLCEQQCGGIKYDLIGGFGGMGDED